MKHIVYKHRKDTRDENASRDPITGAPGSRPVGTGAGAAAGGVAGGMAGKGVGAAIDPTRDVA